MVLFKTVPAYSWIFIYIRKYWNLRNIVENSLKHGQDDSWEILPMYSLSRVSLYVERETRLKKSRVLWVTMFKTIKIYSKNHKIVEFSSYFIGFILEFKIFNWSS